MGGSILDAGAVEIVEKHVAVLSVLAIGRASPILQQNVTAHPHTGRERGCLPRMIGLSRALGQHDIGALIARLRHKEFELSRLVAAGRHPGAVVALDPDLRAIEVASEIGEMFQRRREMTKADARKTCKIHPTHPFSSHSLHDGGGSTPRTWCFGGRTTKHLAFYVPW